MTGLVGATTGAAAVMLDDSGAVLVGPFINSSVMWKHLQWVVSLLACVHHTANMIILMNSQCFRNYKILDYPYSFTYILATPS